MAIKKIVIFHRHVSLPKGKSEKKKNIRNGVLKIRCYTLVLSCLKRVVLVKSAVFLIHCIPRLWPPGRQGLDGDSGYSIWWLYSHCLWGYFPGGIPGVLRSHPSPRDRSSSGSKKTTSAAVMTCTSCIRRCIRKSLRVCNGITPLLII